MLSLLVRLIAIFWKFMLIKYKSCYLQYYSTSEWNIFFHNIKNIPNDRIHLEGRGLIKMSEYVITCISNDDH